jgi:hypothetical protein
LKIEALGVDVVGNMHLTNYRKNIKFWTFETIRVWKVICIKQKRKKEKRKNY